MCPSDSIAGISGSYYLLLICAYWEICLSYPSLVHKPANPLRVKLSSLFFIPYCFNTDYDILDTWMCLDWNIIYFTISKQLNHRKIQTIIKFNQIFGFKAFGIEIVLVIENKWTQLKIFKQFLLKLNESKSKHWIIYPSLFLVP